MPADALANFKIDDPDLPAAIADQALTSGGYPYDKRMKRKHYNKALYDLQVELVKVLSWLQDSGERLVMVFEGRDAAGKGGTIKVVRQYLNPRHARIVALPKPSDRERGEWYFQRYVSHLPTAGEMVLFDRSWYNRAVVEPVMGFCKPAQTDQFMAEAPDFEHMLVREGIHLVKFWLNIGRETQFKRFHDRQHDPLKIWKISPVDRKAITMWDDFTAARDRMLRKSHSVHAPWTIVRFNDKRRGRLNAIRHVLNTLPYAGKDEAAICEIDDTIIGQGSDFLKSGD
jgi:polyphosphate kinase 2